MMKQEGAKKNRMLRAGLLSLCILLFLAAGFFGYHWFTTADGDDLEALERLASDYLKKDLKIARTTREGDFLAAYCFDESDLGTLCVFWKDPLFADRWKTFGGKHDLKANTISSYDCGHGTNHFGPELFNLHIVCGHGFDETVTGYKATIDGIHYYGFSQDDIILDIYVTPFGPLAPALPELVRKEESKVLDQKEESGVLDQYKEDLEQRYPVEQTKLEEIAFEQLTKRLEIAFKDISWRDLRIEKIELVKVYPTNITWPNLGDCGQISAYALEYSLEAAAIPGTNDPHFVLDDDGRIRETPTVPFLFIYQPDGEIVEREKLEVGEIYLPEIRTVSSKLVEGAVERFLNEQNVNAIVDWFIIAQSEVEGRGDDYYREHGDAIRQYTVMANKDFISPNLDYGDGQFGVHLGTSGYETGLLYNLPKWSSYYHELDGGKGSNYADYSYNTVFEGFTERELGNRSNGLVLGWNYYYSVTIDKFATLRGIRVGQTVQQAQTAYPEAFFVEDVQYSEAEDGLPAYDSILCYAPDDGTDCTMLFMVKDGKIVEIAGIDGLGERRYEPVRNPKPGSVW